MKCGICRTGDTRPGMATITLQRGEATVIIKGVPAEVCANCGEYYLSEPVAGEVLERADRAAERGTQVEILRYAA